MTHIERSIDINCPVAEAWAVYADYADVAVWHPYMERAYLDDGSPGEGVGASRVAEFGPKMAIRETVIDWVDDDHMTIPIEFLKGTPPPITDIAAGVQVAGTDGSTTLSLTMDYRPKWGPIGALADVLFVRRQYTKVFDDMLQATKAYAETGTVIPQKAMLGSGRRLP